LRGTAAKKKANFFQKNQKKVDIRQSGFYILQNVKCKTAAHKMESAASLADPVKPITASTTM
jgi:hypothetical protein